MSKMKISIFFKLLLLFPACVSISIVRKNYGSGIFRHFVRYYNDSIFVLNFMNETDFFYVFDMEILPPRYVIDDDIYRKFEVGKIVNIFGDTKRTKNTSWKSFNENGCNVFISQEFSAEFCSLNIINSTPGAFVIDLLKNELFSCFNENGDFSITSISRRDLGNFRKFHRKYANLRGNFLRIFHIDHHTLHCKSNISEGSCTKVGPDAEIIKSLSKSLNFTPIIEEFKNNDSTTIWEEMLDAVFEEKADFAVGAVLMTPRRLTRLQFTYYIWSSAKYGTLFVNPTEELELTVLIRFFKMSIYIINIILLVLIVLIAKLSSYLHRRQYMIINFIFILLKTMLEQSSSLGKRIFYSDSTKLIFVLWLTFMLIISTVFKTKLSSALIKPKVFNFQSVDELIENNFMFFVDVWMYGFFMENLPYTRKVPRIFQSDFRGSKCYKSIYLFTYRVALVYDEFNLVHLIRKCLKTFPPEKISDLSILQETRMYHFYPFTPNSPYRLSFSRKLGQLKASGFMILWYRNLTFTSLHHLINVELNTPKPLTLGHVQTFFFILIAGFIFSISVFLTELLTKKLSSMSH